MKKIEIIGIIGGGQLGMMMCEAAYTLGFKCVVLDPNPNCSASKICSSIIVGSFDDVKAYETLAKQCDIITYEFENIPYTYVKMLMDNGFQIPQGEKPLYITQNRIREKNAIQTLGFTTVKYFEIHSLKQLDEIVHKTDGKFILKTSFGGYDGKGQWHINDESDLANIHSIYKENVEYILEEKITLKKEISCIVHRNAQGETAAQPIFENVHKDGILHYSISPSTLNNITLEQAKSIAISLIEKLNFIGTLAVEMFIDTKDDIFINELAPRPHNSGHLSIEACDYSQFYCHILAITGQPLPKPLLKQNALMLNIIGDEYLSAKTLYCNYYFHDYFKLIQEKRKMAHVTFLGKDADKIKEELV